MLENSRHNHETAVKERLAKLFDNANQMESKIAGIKFKIERKCIKNNIKEERRMSIHRLELEKDLNFHPKKSRANSQPEIKVSVRLEALKDMKEELLLRRCKIAEEVLEDEPEIKIPTLEYCFNDINRKILDQPKKVKKYKTIVKPRLSKQDNPRESLMMDSANVIVEEHKSSGGESNSGS